MSDQEKPEVIEPLFKTPSLLDKVPNIFFTKVTDEKSNLEYDHTDFIFIHYSDDKNDKTHLEKIQEIKDYINASALKLLEESKNIYSNIDVLPTFVDSVNLSSGLIIDNITNGIDKYTPFLSEMEEDGKTIKNKPVVLGIKIGITKTNSAVSVPLLIWVTTSHSWKHSEKDDTSYDLINTIELFSE